MIVVACELGRASGRGRCRGSSSRRSGSRSSSARARRASAPASSSRRPAARGRRSGSCGSRTSGPSTFRSRSSRAGRGRARVDLAAVDLELRHALDRVVLPVREARRRPGLPVRRRDDERREQHERGDGEAGDLPVHARALERVRAVGDEQQPGEQDEVGDDARAAVADERERDPGQRDQPQDPADDDERLQREGEGEARGEQLREAVVGEQRDPEPAQRRRPCRRAAAPAAPISPSSCASAE